MIKYIFSSLDKAIFDLGPDSPKHYKRFRGGGNSHTKRKNMLTVSKRVRRKHRRARV